MKQIFSAYFLFVIIFLSCTSPSLLFTEEQFSKTYSETSIPEKWFGEWTPSDLYNKNESKEIKNFYISRDSLLIGEFEYKIDQSKMDLDTLPNSEKDKLIFKDNWCYLFMFIADEYQTQEGKVIPRDSLNIDPKGKRSGYQVFIANYDKTGRIKFWQMTYEYLLKNQLVDEIPIKKLFYNNILNNSVAKKIDEAIVYVQIPKDINKYSYRRIIKNLPIVFDVPYLCTSSYDFDFFQKIANSKTPDIILKPNHKSVVNTKNNIDKNFKKISRKNLIKQYIKFIQD